jgi:hypothetical protein
MDQIRSPSLQTHPQALQHNFHIALVCLGSTKLCGYRSWNCIQFTRCFLQDLCTNIAAVSVAIAAVLVGTVLCLRLPADRCLTSVVGFFIL